MKSLGTALIGLMLILTACTGQPRGTPEALASATAAPTLPTAPTATHLPVDLPPAQRAAIARLAEQLGLPAEQVKVVSSEAVTWPNGCLGLQRIGIMCTQNEVPGFRMVLEAAGKQYELHTNQDGTLIVPEEAVEAAGPAQSAATKQLASNLGIPEAEVKLVSSSVVEWPDTCLGVAQEGVMCAQVVTSGHLILLEASGRQYEYHTNEDASRIVPGSLALSWKQHGGIAGLCQNLTVYLSGEVYGMDCRPNGDGKMGTLTSAQRAQLYTWIDELDESTVDISDPKTAADAMIRMASLQGTGRQQASKDEQRAIFDFGQALYQELFP